MENIYRYYWITERTPDELLDIKRQDRREATVISILPIHHIMFIA